MKRASGDRGASIVELLITVMIGAIVVLSIGAPYITGRQFFGKSLNKTQAQRDAHQAVKQMAEVARSASSYSVTGTGPSVQVSFVTGCGTVSFGRGSGAASNQLIETNGCTGQTLSLVDGQRSAVQDFAVTSISSALLGLAIHVSHGGNPDETLATQIFVRN